MAQAEGREIESQPPGLDLREVEYLVDDCQQGLGRLPDVPEVLALLGTEGGFQDEVGEPDDRIHRRPDLVTHVGQELGLDAARLERRVPRRLHLVQHAKLIAHVVRDPYAPDRLASGSAEQRRRDRHRDAGPVPGEERDALVAHLRRLGRVGPSFDVPSDGAPDELGLAVPEERAGRVVGHGDAATSVDDHQRIVHRGHHGPQAVALLADPGGRVLEVLGDLADGAAQPYAAGRADDHEQGERQPGQRDRLPCLRLGVLRRLRHLRGRDPERLIDELQIERASTQVLLEVDALRRHRIRLDQAEELVLDPIGDLAVMRIQLFEQSPEVATPRRVRRGGEVLGGGIVRLALGRPRVDETRLEHEPAHRIAARQVVGPQAPNGRADLERRGLRRLRPAHGLAEARDHGEAGEHPEAEEEREADRDEYGYAFSHRRAGVSV